jgi:hypothetical protein
MVFALLSRGPKPVSVALNNTGTGLTGREGETTLVAKSPFEKFKIWTYYAFAVARA